MKVLVTGGAGFIGSHLVKLLLRETDWQVFNVDKLTYAGNPENLTEVKDDPRYKFFQTDIADMNALEKVFENKFDYVLHLAAETHVDNSINNAAPFLQTNVTGTYNLLELSRRNNVKKFLYVSTDEVYGDLPIETDEKFDEKSPLKPSSPYSSSKASGDLLALSFFRTYGLPVMISRCTNNYGTHQYPEKLIPFFTKKLLNNEKAPLYGDGKNVREWIHVEDHNKALLVMLAKGEVGNVYNIGSGDERSNRQIFESICKVLEKNPEDSFELVDDRLGHDRRYALDSNKLRNLGWQPEKNFDEAFGEIILWYKDKFSV